MAQFCLIAVLVWFAALCLAPAAARADALEGSDLYDRPVLAIDPGAHAAPILSQAVDAEGRFAVTGGDDRTVRVWSLADGKLVKTIRVPIGPGNVGRVYAVAISPDGFTIAAGGWTGHFGSDPIYIFERESGRLITRITDDLQYVTLGLAFSRNGRYLAAGLYGSSGLRVFDARSDWRQAFRDNEYGGDCYGVAFAPDGRLATSSFDGSLRFYAYNADAVSANFRRVGEPLEAPSGQKPRGLTFSPDGKRLAVGYYDVAAVDILDAATLRRLGGHNPTNARMSPDGLIGVAWSRDNKTLFAAGSIVSPAVGFLLFAWDSAGLGE